MRKALPALIFLTAAAAIWLSGRLDGDWRIDEAHKISETARLSPRAWQNSRAERANPPVGKWIFALAAPPVPYDPAFTERAARGERVPPPHLRPAYERALPRVRWVSLIATALTAALVWVLSESILAVLLYFFSFLTQTFAATAVFDPLLTLLVVSAAVPVGKKITWPRTVAAAVLAGLAIDVRLSGGLALIGVLALLLVRGRWREALAATGISVALAAALNPFFFSQFEDLRILLAETGEHRLAPLEKLQFVSEYAFGDWVGIALLTGVVLAAFQPREPLLAWAAAIAVVFTAWLPVGYPRYVLVAIPPLAIASAYGWSAAAAYVRKRSTGSVETPNGSRMG